VSKFSGGECEEPVEYMGWQKAATSAGVKCSAGMFGISKEGSALCIQSLGLKDEMKQVMMTN
jgi:hypothetical protein